MIKFVTSNRAASRLDVPSEMLPADGSPLRGDQLVGSPAEILAELAGRICYDSLGSPSSRASAGYHKHVLEVGHLSVYEHPHVVFEIPGTVGIEHFFNRPSMRVQVINGNTRICCNLRHLLEFEQSFGGIGCGSHAFDRFCCVTRNVLRDVAPQIAAIVFGGSRDEEYTYKILDPYGDDWTYVTLYMSGSRGWSHEQVRHGDWTAISQRSTRYCSEEDAEMILHPEIHKYLAQAQDGGYMADRLSYSFGVARSTYASVFARLRESGCDLKTARGAARSMLPFATQTEMIFTASVSAWRHMWQLRSGAAADGEIREIFLGLPATMAEAGIAW